MPDVSFPCPRVESLVDVGTLATVVASASVVIGVVLAVLQLRDLAKTRQADLLMGLYTAWGGQDLQEAAGAVLRLQFNGYEEFAQKYGPVDEGKPIHLALFKLGWFFNGIGVLVNGKLADIRLVDDLFGYMVTWLWGIMEPIVQGSRQLYGQPRSLEWFEYLAKRIKAKGQVPSG